MTVIDDAVFIDWLLTFSRRLYELIFLFYYYVSAFAVIHLG